MKNRNFLLIILLSLLMVSCGSDDYKAPSIEGTWVYNSRTISSDHPEVDNLVNKQLKADAEIIDTERTFGANGKMSSSRYVKATNDLKAKSDYTYRIDIDTLEFRQEISNDEWPIKRTHHAVSKDILTTKQVLRNEDINNLMDEIGYGIISLPDNFKATYITLEIRQ